MSWIVILEYTWVKLVAYLQVRALVVANLVSWLLKLCLFSTLKPEMVHILHEIVQEFAKGHICIRLQVRPCGAAEGGGRNIRAEHQGETYPNIAKHSQT